MNHELISLIGVIASCVFAGMVIGFFMGVAASRPRKKNCDPHHT